MAGQGWRLWGRLRVGLPAAASPYPAASFWAPSPEIKGWVESQASWRTASLLARRRPKGREVAVAVAARY